MKKIFALVILISFNQMLFCQVDKHYDLVIYGHVKGPVQEVSCREIKTALEEAHQRLK